MTDNVLPFPGDKKTVADIIQEISDRGVTELIVIGYDRSNKEFMTGTIDDGAELNWLLDRLKWEIMISLTQS